MNKIRVLLVDETEIFRKSITKMLDLKPRIKIVGSLACLKEAIEKIEETVPDVIITELLSEEERFFDEFTNISNTWPHIKVVVFTHSENPIDILHTIQLGAIGYISKSCTLDNLIKAIELIADGLFIISPPLASKIQKELSVVDLNSKVKLTDGKSKLSAREYQVINLLAEGATNRDIAQKLFITENTVKTHLHNIMGKLDTRSRLQVALLANGSADQLHV